MESICKAGHVMRRLEKAKGRCRSHRKKGNAGTADIGSAGVMDQMCFFPLLARKDDFSLDKSREVSLTHALLLAKEMLGIERQDNDILPFPFNIVNGFARIETYVKERNPSAETLLVESEGKVSVGIRHRYNTGMTLYYIPVLPIFLLLKKNRKCGELLLAVASYLTRFAGVPYYRNGDSYMYWQYEMLRDWLEADVEAWEPESFQLNSEEICAADIIGDIMGRKLYSPGPLERLERQLRAFKPEDDFEWECKNVAEITLMLWKEYPNDCYWQNMRPPLDYEYLEDCISPDRYISFVYDFGGWLGEMLLESINNELNEYGSIAEPEAFNLLDGDPKELQQIDYEVRLLDLINRLCALL